LPALLDKGDVDVITFASSSSVKNLLTRLELDSAEAAFFENVVIACIGTKTAGTARSLGFSVDVVGAEHTVCGLTTALEQYFDSH
jgi:uroporphyrinogen III methyltransferase/synthase